MTSAPAAAPGARSPWAVFAVVALGTFMATLDSSIVNVALPTLARTFHATVTQIEWISLGYVLTITGLLLPFGRLGDAVGRRSVFLWGLALFTLGSLACAFAHSTGTLIAARLFQGVGASMVSANSVALITQAVPPAMRGRALGMVGAVVGLGLTVGPPLGGLLLSVASWPWIFLVNLPIGVAGVLCAAAVLPRTQPGTSPARPPFDLAGAVLAMAMLIGLTLVLSRGATWGWRSPATLAGVAGTVLALALFIAVERRARDPLIDFAFFADPAFRTPMLALFLAFAALFSVVFLVPFYLERIGGLAPADVGRVLVVVPLLLLMVSPASGALSDRVGTRRLAVLGLGLTCAGLALLAWLIGRAGDRPVAVPAIIAGLFVVGAGQGFFQPPNSSSAMGSVPPDRLGLAGGLLATMRNLGTLCGIGMAAAVYEGREQVYARSYGAVHAAGLGMRDAFLAAALVAALGTALVLAGRSVPRKA